MTTYLCNECEISFHENLQKCPHCWGVLIKESGRERKGTHFYVIFVFLILTIILIVLFG